jgi:hypothetical protein
MPFDDRQKLTQAESLKFRISRTHRQGMCDRRLTLWACCFSSSVPARALSWISSGSRETRPSVSPAAAHQQTLAISRCLLRRRQAYPHRPWRHRTRRGRLPAGGASLTSP